MGPHYTKRISLTLIHFAKKMTITGGIFDPASTSAFTFGRQMRSPLLKKTNPNFEFKFIAEGKQTQPPNLKAEFINGRVWETETAGKLCSDLRSEVQ